LMVLGIELRALHLLGSTLPSFFFETESPYVAQAGLELLG
jgi:hypothetical protein